MTYENDVFKDIIGKIVKVTWKY